MTWDVDHRRRPEDDICPVCGEGFDHAMEYYPDPSTTVASTGRAATWCFEAGVASASPDPTLIVFEHK